MAKLWPFFLILLYVKVVLCCGPTGSRSNDFCVEATLKGLENQWADDLAFGNPGKLIYRIIKSNFDSHMLVIAMGTNYRNRDIKGKLCRFEKVTESEAKVFVKLSAKAEQADVEKIIATTIFDPFEFSSPPRITTMSSCSGC